MNKDYEEIVENFRSLWKTGKIDEISDYCAWLEEQGFLESTVTKLFVIGTK